MSTGIPNNPLHKLFGFDLIVLKEPSSVSKDPFATVPMRAIFTENPGHISCVCKEDSSTRSSKAYGEIKFNIKGKVLQIIELSSKHDEITYKLIIIAHEFFRFHNCKQIQAIAKPRNVIPFLLHGFLPQVDEFRVTTDSQVIRDFNDFYNHGKDFTCEAYKAIGNKYKKKLAKTLKCKVSKITYEIFLKKWSWDCSTCEKYYKITKLARTIFQANDKEKQEKAEALLSTQAEIPMNLPTHAVKIYEKEAVLFPNTSFESKIELRSVWLPRFPKERIVNLSKDLSIPFICEVKGPFHEGRNYHYQISQDSKPIGKVHFSIGKRSIHILNIELFERPHEERNVMLQALLDIASEAAFTNSHCRGRVDMTLNPGSDLATALKDFGYTKDLSGILQPMSVSDRASSRATDIEDTLFELDPKTARRWRKPFYAKRLQEELTLMITGEHPYSPSDSLENHIHSHNTLYLLLIHLDLLMPDCEKDEGSFKNKVMEYYYLHATPLLKRSKLRCEKTEKTSTDIDKHIRSAEDILFSECPLILYVAIYKVLCEVSKTLMYSTVLKESPNFKQIFKKIQNASFADKANRSVTPAPLPAVPTNRRASLPDEIPTPHQLTRAKRFPKRPQSVILPPS